MTQVIFLQDRRSAVIKLLNFIGKELSDQAIETLVEQCAFENMRDNVKVNYATQSEWFDISKGSLLRRGTAANK